MNENIMMVGDDGGQNKARGRKRHLFSLIKEPGGWGGDLRDGGLIEMKETRKEGRIPLSALY